MPPRVSSPETLSPPLNTRRRSSSFERWMRKVSGKRDESVVHHLREAGDVLGGIGGAPALLCAPDVRRAVLQQLALLIGQTSPSSPTRPSIRPCDSPAIKVCTVWCILAMFATCLTGRLNAVDPADLANKRRHRQRRADRRRCGVV